VRVVLPGLLREESGPLLDPAASDVPEQLTSHPHRFGPGQAASTETTL